VVFEAKKSINNRLVVILLYWILKNSFLNQCIVYACLCLIFNITDQKLQSTFQILSSVKNKEGALIVNKIYFKREMITWPKFSWSKLSFFSWSKVLINILSLDQITWPNHLTKSLDWISWSKLLLMSFWVILKFWSTAKKELMDFGSNHLTESLDRITWPNQLIGTFINVILSYFKVLINWPIFRRLTKKFDQLIRSSEIRSTDPLSFKNIPSKKFHYYFVLILCKR
jgi:hypothetical protein